MMVVMMMVGGGGDCGDDGDGGDGGDGEGDDHDGADDDDAVDGYGYGHDDAAAAVQHPRAEVPVECGWGPTVADPLGRPRTLHLRSKSSTPGQGE